MCRNFQWQGRYLHTHALYQEQDNWACAICRSGIKLQNRICLNWRMVCQIFRCTSMKFYISSIFIQKRIIISPCVSFFNETPQIINYKFHWSEYIYTYYIYIYMARYLTKQQRFVFLFNVTSPIPLHRLMSQNFDSLKLKSNLLQLIWRKYTLETSTVHCMWTWQGQICE